MNPEKESSGSQFYIVQGRVFSVEDLNMMIQRGMISDNKEIAQIYTTLGGTPHLDGSYTVFGEVVEGLEGGPECDPARAPAEGRARPRILGSRRGLGRLRRPHREHGPGLPEPPDDLPPRAPDPVVGRRDQPPAEGRAPIVAFGFLAFVGLGLVAMFLLAPWYTARQVARKRPRRPIVALAKDDRVLRQLALVWGVAPLRVRPHAGTDDMLRAVEDALVDARFADVDDLVVITAGLPVGGRGTTNLLKVHRIKESP